MGNVPHVVIADDSEIMRYALTRFLERSCKIVGQAQDGVEAVEIVDRLQPDIVVLDISMPRMNGFQAAARIKELAPSVRIIFFSSHSETMCRDEVQRLGADEYVVKSGDTATDLLAAIERCFDTRLTASKGL